MDSKYILGCINGFTPSESVIDYACWLTKTLNKELKLFHTLDQQYHENPADLSGSIGLGAREDMLKEIVEIEHQQNKLLQQKAKLILDSGKEQAEKNGVQDVDLCLRRGKLLENIMDLKDKVSVAVIGKYGKRHQGAEGDNPVGHKVEGLVRSLKKPILIVSEPFVEPKSICLAFDDSEGANKALDFICEYKGPTAIEVHIVFVGEEFGEIKEALKEAQNMLKSRSIDSKISIIPGEPDEALNQYMNDNDVSLLAMGAFGHNWLHDFVMGSVTSKIIKNLKKPLLLVR